MIIITTVRKNTPYRNLRKYHERSSCTKYYTCHVFFSADLSKVYWVGLSHSAELTGIRWVQFVQNKTVTIFPFFVFVSQYLLEYFYFEQTELNNYWYI